MRSVRSFAAMPIPLSDRSGFRTWGLMLTATLLVLAGGLSPPLLPPAWRALAMRVFSPVCHQLPGRSPHLDGVQLAICDRCTGIYIGLVVGVAAVGWARPLWTRLHGASRYLLLGSLLPLGVDWLAPVLGLWTNVPLSRAGTGMAFGVVAASFAAHRLLNGFADRSRSIGSPRSRP